MQTSDMARVSVPVTPCTACNPPCTSCVMRLVMTGDSHHAYEISRIASTLLSMSAQVMLPSYACLLDGGGATAPLLQERPLPSPDLVLLLPARTCRAARSAPSGFVLRSSCPWRRHTLGCALRGCTQAACGSGMPQPSPAPRQAARPVPRGTHGQPQHRAQAQPAAARQRAARRIARASPHTPAAPQARPAPRCTQRPPRPRCRRSQARSVGGPAAPQARPAPRCTLRPPRP